VATVAATLGRSREKVIDMLEELAALFGSLGIGAAAAHARVPAAVAALAALRRGVRAAMDAPPPLRSADSDLVMAGADEIAGYVRAAKADAIAPLSDLPSLLRAWAQAPAKVADKVARPDWLLDGWERICLLWQDDPQRSETLLREMAGLVPVIPREAAEWVPAGGRSAAGVMQIRPLGAGGEDWRSGDEVQDRIARNERLQARALASA
jgi:hypothetical protein